jgi:hypothetical protein
MWWFFGGSGLDRRWHLRTEGGELDVPPALRAAAAPTLRVREPRPAGFPLLFSSTMQLIEPAVAFLHERYFPLAAVREPAAPIERSASKRAHGAAPTTL